MTVTKKSYKYRKNTEVINQITDVISEYDSVTLLDVDPGKDTNRTVVTFVGDPESVLNVAYSMIEIASKLIDMSKHVGCKD